MCMGPPFGLGCLIFIHRVYPHVYGATLQKLTAMWLNMGLSPCVWGHHLVHPDQTILPGSIPMCMGPPTIILNRTSSTGVYPHVYGATTDYVVILNLIWGLSPCVWGHRIRSNLSTPLWGSIPMCMGPPLLPDRLLLLCWVYPHVYGATSAISL